MDIKVCGPGCSACEKTFKVVEAALAAKGVAATITKVSDFQEFARLGVLTTPAVVIDGQVKCIGRVPKQQEVENWLD